MWELVYTRQSKLTWIPPKTQSFESPFAENPAHSSCFWDCSPWSFKEADSAKETRRSPHHHRVGHQRRAPGRSIQLPDELIAEAILPKTWNRRKAVEYLNLED